MSRHHCAARAAVLLTVATLLAGCGDPGFPAHENVARYLAPPPQASPSGRSGTYLGVYEPGVPRRHDLVARFAAEIGRMPNLMLYYRHWGQPFDQAFADYALAHGAVPLMQLDPGQFTLAQIRAGRGDRYLHLLAAQLRAYGRPVVMGFAREMNGGWFPWGKGHASPRSWIAAWRHIVTTIRRAGADNVTWQWTINDIGPGIGAPRRWWPGAAYVNWVGIDGYYYSDRDSFSLVFGQTITVVRKITRKPILISEVAMDPRAARATQFRQLFAGVRQRHLLGLVWFDARARRDWRLEDNPPALMDFAREAHWITYPRPGPS